jgi:hypothetical protein
LAGWSFVASGRAVESAVRDGIKDALNDVLEDAGHGLEDSSFKTTDQGWAVAANGDAEAPETHRRLLARLKAVLDRPEAETGSSSYSSAHVTASNFHDPAPQTPATPAPPAAAGEGDLSGPPS